MALSTIKDNMYVSAPTGGESIDCAISDLDLNKYLKGLKEQNQD